MDSEIFPRNAKYPLEGCKGIRTQRRQFKDSLGAVDCVRTSRNVNLAQDSDTPNSFVDMVLWLDMEEASPRKHYFALFK